MECPNFHQENPETRNFCRECGSHLIIPSESTRKGLAANEKLTQIQRYIPKTPAEKIVSQLLFCQY